MNSEPIILEISSEEDSGLGELNADSPDWLSELFGDGNVKCRDSDDDVVVVDGDSCDSTIKKQNFAESNEAKCVSENNSDDDCLVLDANPDNSVAAVNELGNESDDLRIVWEKGQIACRDYPHPRHLCANFPFSTTAHEQYCNLCHCYVCDSRAPCIYWGTGAIFTDHCNSTDKEEVWRTQRKNFKGIVAAPPIVKVSNTTPAMRATAYKPVPKSSQLRAYLSTSFSRTGNNGPNLCLSLKDTRNRQPQRKQMTRMPAVYRERRGFLIPPNCKVKSTSQRRSNVAVNQSGQLLNNGNLSYTVVQPSQRTQTSPADDIQLKRLQDFLLSDSEPSVFQNYSKPNSNCSFTDFHCGSISSQPQAYYQSHPQLDVNQDVHQFGTPAQDATNPDTLDNNSMQSNVASRSNPMDHTLQSVQPFELPVIMQAEGEHMESTLGSLGFADENWIHSTLEHQVSVQENAVDPSLSDLAFFPIQLTTVDPGGAFYESDNLWTL